MNGNHKGDGVTTIDVPDLQPNTHYIVTIVAVCDENCQKGDINEIQGEAFDCDKIGKVLCKAYKSMKIVTGEKIVKSGWGPYIIVAIVVVVLSLCAGFIVWKRRVSSEQTEQYQMQDVNTLNFSLDTLNMGIGKKASRYEPLVSGYVGDEGDAEIEDEGKTSLITHF